MVKSLRVLHFALHFSEVKGFLIVAWRINIHRWTKSCVPCVLHCVFRQKMFPDCRISSTYSIVSECRSHLHYRFSIIALDEKYFIRSGLYFHCCMCSFVDKDLMVYYRWRFWPCINSAIPAVPCKTTLLTYLEIFGFCWNTIFVVHYLLTLFSADQYRSRLNKTSLVSWRGIMHFGALWWLST